LVAARAHTADALQPVFLGGHFIEHAIGIGDAHKGELERPEAEDGLRRRVSPLDPAEQSQARVI
jgi:hypothetical protein